MGDFEEIHIIKTGVQPFITFIIGAAMEHFMIDKLIIIPKQRFPQQEEFRFQRIAKRAQTPEKIAV